MRSTRFLILAVGAFGLLGLGARPAQADSNFERGFESELGRIAAHGAVGLGHHWLREVLGDGRHHYRHPPRRHESRRDRAYRHEIRRHRERPRYFDHWGAWDRRDARRHRRGERRHRGHRHHDGW